MTPDPLDLHIGRRIRRRRNMLGLTQARVARACDLNFRTIQKYECAAHRVFPVHLLHLARALRVEVSYFFEGFDEGVRG